MEQGFPLDFSSNCKKKWFESDNFLWHIYINNDKWAGISKKTREGVCILHESLNDFFCEYTFIY